MVRDYISQIDPEKEYRWITVLTTMYVESYASHKQFVDVMRTCFRDEIFQHVFFHTTEIINSAVQYLSPYEQSKPSRRVLQMLDGMFGEIELRFMREWSSKRAALLQKGIA
jgi:chromosome partitioning protein